MIPGYLDPLGNSYFFGIKGTMNHQKAELVVGDGGVAGSRSFIFLYMFNVNIKY